MKLHELPEHVVIVTVKTAEAAHIPPKEQADFNDLSFPGRHLSLNADPWVS